MDSEVRRMFAVALPSPCALLSHYFFSSLKCLLHGIAWRPQAVSFSQHTHSSSSVNRSRATNSGGDSFRLPLWGKAGPEAHPVFHPQNHLQAEQQGRKEGREKDCFRLMCYTTSSMV